MGAQIAGLSRLTVAATKEIVDTMTAGRPTSALVNDWVARADSGPDIAEGIAAFDRPAASGLHLGAARTLERWRRGTFVG